MTIQQLLQEVLDLQPHWSHLKTPEMDRRGIIVRRELREALEAHSFELSRALSPFDDDFSVEGRDGTGPKTEIPWTRLYSEARSPHATTGWYVVYLFSALGDNCYLTLGHGSTEWTGVDFQPRPQAVLRDLMVWARTRLASDFSIRSDCVEVISLDARRSNLGPAYEAGTALGFRYRSGAVPVDEVLVADLEYMLGLLAALYRYEESEDAIPGAVPPEVLDAVEEASKAAGRKYKRPSGQGRRQSAAERSAIEMRAVQVVTEYLHARHFATDYVGDSESYDIKARHGDEVVHIEVKGTTSLGQEVVLTANEVEFHKATYPHNALIVVHSILLKTSDDSAPIASGGVLHVHRPWQIADDSLKPVSYRYSVPKGWSDEGV